MASRAEPQPASGSGPGATRTGSTVGGITAGDRSATPLPAPSALVLDTGHRLSARLAAGQLIGPGGVFAAGNRAATGVIRQRLAVQRDLSVQRETRAEATAWLSRFLALRGARLSAELPAAATRLAGWSLDRSTALLARQRSAVDAFEIAVGAGGLLTSADAGRVLGILEGAQTNEALGNRLVVLFRSSVEPVLGLVIAAAISESRLRAVLQAHPTGRVAIEAVRTRNPAAGVPAAVRSTYDRLGELVTELAAPLTALVTPSTPAREAAVESILTPPAVAAARHAAAVAGLPPPAFIPAGYYEDLLAGLHQTVLNEFPRYERWNRRRRMDTRPGGHVEGIATEAKARVDALFGQFGSGPAPALTFAAGNLADQTATAGDPFSMAQWYVTIGAANRPAIAGVQSAHNSFEDATAAQAIENRVIEHYSGISRPVAAGEVAALAGLGMPEAERIRRLQIIDRMWPGLADGGNVAIRAREGATSRETRGLYWGLLKTMIHEYLHTTDHPAYEAFFRSLLDSHHQTTYQEGVTDLFTLQTWNSIFPNEITANRAFRLRIQGPADGDLDLGAVGGPPGHYAELAEAQRLERLFGTANLRAAYFRGNVAVLGAGRLPR